MDLLDLELDLNVEDSSSPGRKTRRSQNNAAASTAPSNVTPKSNKIAKQSTVTPKPKTATKKTTLTPKTPAKPRSKTTAAAGDVVEEPMIEVKIEPKDETVPNEGTSEERQARSPSTDKRSRHKVKKRFSPSPVAKKRKLMPIATPTPTTSKKSSKKKNSTVANEEQFGEGLRDYGDKISLESHTDFDIPNEWKTGTSSEAVEQTMVEKKARSAEDGSNISTAETATSQTPKQRRKSAASKKVQLTTASSSSLGAKSSTSPTIPNTVDSLIDESRASTVSRELGIDDDELELTPAPKRQKKTSTVKTPKEAANSEKKLNRRVSRKVEFEQEKKEESEEREGSMEPLEVTSEATSSRRSSGNRRKSYLKSASQFKVSEEQPPTSSSSNETMETAKPNPNSALAIKKRLMGEATASPGNKKTKAAEKKIKKEQDPTTSEPLPTAEVLPTETEEEEKDTKVEEVPVPESPAPSTSAAKKAITPAVPPTRASARVSKPNRLYNDESFNTEVLGRTRVTEQNPVKEVSVKRNVKAQAKETTPELDIPLPASARRRSVAVPRAPPPPKPVPVINGVLRGYVPSVKVPLEDYEVDGTIVKLNEDVMETLDVILFKVCKDGLVKHEDIDPKVVKAKTKAKIDNAKRLKLESKKLDIQMKVKIPTSSEELGKRKRQAPKSIDEIYWTPSVNRQKVKSEQRDEEREETPLEDQDTFPTDERRQQKARESISNLFDAEMDATMKEAKTNFSVRFEDYIRPKVKGAQKHAKIKLMSRRRQSADPEDFYYQELFTDQISPSASNIENVEEAEEIDVMGMDDEMEPEEEISQEKAIYIRTEALDIAEQISTIIPRPVNHDGTPMTMEHIQMKTLEHLESRRNCLADTMGIVLNQLSHEMSPPTRGLEEQGCIWHTVTSANAQVLKNIYTVCDELREDAITWSHLFMIENLPVHILASYLSLLRYAKKINPPRIGYIINSTVDIDQDWIQITGLIKSFAHKRGIEPGTEVLRNTIPFRRFENTVFLLVPPTLTIGDNQRHRQHGRIFRWLQSIGHPDSELIAFNDKIDPTCSVAEYLSDLVVDRICEKVRQKNTEKPHCNIVVVGYGASTYLVHRAANLVGGISAIISIGFPVITPYGRRGTADDEILLTYCPTLFIVGAEGQRFNNEAMTELRASMISNTGLIVVGHASDLLMLPTSFLIRLGISQTVVSRIILEKILDFISLPAVREIPSSELVPIELNNVYDLDSSLLKSDKALSGLAFAGTPSATSSAAPSPVGASGRRATVTGASGDDAAKKRREVAFHPIHSISSSNGGVGGSITPTPRSDGNYLAAFQNLVTSTVATADDMPRRASMGASPRIVERGDFRDHRNTGPRHQMSSSSVSQQNSSHGPIDPASISLN
ncbi:hypothetical protein CRE_18565 [Caenorhabditis remanei]|uniref:KANSL3 helical domain-containing protein n=1 Tax=Caenorhabditis remanei TaxID=31234 RepID=E3LJV4_CAERE|nr:hypothetical protein CRE_18565 [Caenorhabditis remanei]